MAFPPPQTFAAVCTLLEPVFWGPWKAPTNCPCVRLWVSGLEAFCLWPRWQLSSKMARGWGWGYVKARTPSCTRLITFWFISKLLGFVFPNTSNLKPLHLSCLAGMCAAWLPVFHSCPLVPTPCLCHLRPELTAGGAPVGRWGLAFFQSGPWWAGPTFSPGMALGTELSVGYWGWDVKCEAT